VSPMGAALLLRLHAAGAFEPCDGQRTSSPVELERYADSLPALLQRQVEMELARRALDDMCRRFPPGQARPIDRRREPGCRPGASYRCDPTCDYELLPLLAFEFEPVVRAPRDVRRVCAFPNHTLQAHAAGRVKDGSRISVEGGAYAHVFRGSFLEKHL
jgi:hypothetical protein